MDALELLMADHNRVRGLFARFQAAEGSNHAQAARLAAKLWGLRILHGEKSCSDIGAPLLVVSQFTLYGDARKGRRPTWAAAAPGPVSEPVYDAFCTELGRLGARVERGVFGADMQVALVNDGPVTMLLETPAGAGGP